jgi:hypothetical protein
MSLVSANLPWEESAANLLHVHNASVFYFFTYPAEERNPRTLKLGISSVDA